LPTWVAGRTTLDKSTVSVESASAGDAINIAIVLNAAWSFMGEPFAQREENP
jgi:hypothetical protein